MPYYLLDVFYFNCINILEHANIGRELILFIFNETKTNLSKYKWSRPSITV